MVRPLIGSNTHLYHLAPLLIRNAVAAVATSTTAASFCYYYYYQILCYRPFLDYIGCPASDLLGIV